MSPIGFRTSNSQMPTDQDEMPHKATFHQGIHCLLRQKRSSGKSILFGNDVIKSMTPRNIQWMYQTTRKNALVLKIRLAPVLKHVLSMCHFIYLELV